MRAKIQKSCRNGCSVPKLCSTANWSSTSGGATTATFYFNWQSENKAVTHSVSPAAKCQSVGRVGLLTCRIKRASSAACCTVDREGAALVGIESSSPRHHFELSSWPCIICSRFSIQLEDDYIWSGARDWTMRQWMAVIFSSVRTFPVAWLLIFHTFPWPHAAAPAQFTFIPSLTSVASRASAILNPASTRKLAAAVGKHIGEMKLLMGLRWNRWHSFAMRRLWAPCLVYRCRSQPHFPHFSSEAIDKPALSWLINRLSDWLLTSHFISN